ncbi:MAG: phage tail tape measure protein [Bacteroidales bacterium]|nr:phage tail tape measure protein [Candidatus Liminaster caballi]
MAKKLQPDVIAWSLKINGTQAQKEMRNLQDSSANLKKEQDQLRKSMATLVAQGRKETEEYRRLDAALKENRKQTDLNRQKMEALQQRMKTSDMTAAQLEQRMKTLTKALKNTSRSLEPDKYRALEAELRKTSEAYRATAQQTGVLGKALGGLVKMKDAVIGFFLGMALAITGTLLGAIGKLPQVIADFEKANSNLAAVLGTTKAHIKDLTNEALRLGAATRYSASEVTGLQTELAKLGFGKESIKAMTPSVLTFATAVGTDLSSAASLAGATLRIFGLEAEDCGRVLSTMAVGCTKSALSFDYLNNAMATVGPVANAFGFTIEETTAMLGALANAGFEANSAATATRNILLNLADANGKLATELGRPVTNLDELVQGLRELNARGVDLAKTLELTDKRSVAAFNSFLQGTDSLIQVRDAVTNCEGAFEAMAAEMADNVQGAMAILSSTWEGVILRFYESRGAMRAAVEGLTEVVAWVGRVIDWADRHVTLVKALITGVGSYLVLLKAQVAYTKMAELWQKRYNVQLSLTSVGHKALRTAQLLGAAAQALFTGNVKKATAALRLMKIEMLANPWTLAAAAVAALVAGLVTLADKTKKLTETQKALNAVEHDVTEATAAEEGNIKRLVKELDNVNTSEERRVSALEELKKATGQANLELNEQGRLTSKSIQLINRHIDALKREARAEAYKKKLAELYVQQEQQQQNYDTAKQKEHTAKMALSYTQSQANRQLGTSGTRNLAVGGSVERANASAAQYQREQAEQALNSTNAAIAELEGKYSAVTMEIENMGAAAADAGNTVTTETQQGNEELDYQLATLKELQDELKRLKKARETAMGDNLVRVNSKIASVEAEIRTRKGTTPTAKPEKSVKEKPEEDDLKKYQEYRDRRLKIQQSFYQTQADQMEKAVLDQRITQEQADAYMLGQDKANTEARLAIAQEYLKKVMEDTTMSEQKRADAIREAGDQVREAQMENYRAIAAVSQKVQELVSNPVSLEDLQRNLELQKEQVRIAYDAMIQVATEAGIATDELQRHRDAELSQLDYDYQQHIYSITSEYSQSWSAAYDNELAKLQKMHRDGLMSEKDFQKARLQLQMKNAKKYYDYYSGLSSTMFQAIADAEIATSDAKYDVLIQQAQNNGEDTAQLEEDKANAQLEIQKKYADVNFAIKCSTIIADTAVAIMTAFSQLGPIAGAVAAGLLTVTGIAQLASAKAERDKIKNMSLSHSAGGSSKPAATATRSVGFSDGGPTGEGGRYEVAGVVHKGEYVVAQPELEKPEVVDAVGMIEAIRQQRLHGGAAQTQGFAEGGATSPMAQSDGFASLSATVKDLKQTVDGLRNIRAYIVYQDLERAEQTITNARDYFSRG